MVSFADLPMAQAEVRPEIHPVETVTLSGRQFLLGDPAGKPTTLAAELRLPVTSTGRLPAVILSGRCWRAART